MYSKLKTTCHVVLSLHMGGCANYATGLNGAATSSPETPPPLHMARLVGLLACTVIIFVQRLHLQPYIM